jgi:hypothetical protein
MKPGTRMFLNRCTSLADAIVTVVLAVALIVTCGVAFFLVTTPALPVVLSLSPSPIHAPPPRATATFAGDSMAAHVTPPQPPKKESTK